MIYSILNMINSLTVSQPISVIKFIWVPAHADIAGNEYADSVCREINKREDRVYVGIPLSNLKNSILIPDKLAWLAKDWPYTDRDLTGNTCFSRVTYKSVRPWFRDLSLPRN